MLLTWSTNFAMQDAICKHLTEPITDAFQDKAAPPFIDSLPRVIPYGLALFPVFSISTNFPLIAITLRNNLRAWVPLLQKNSQERLASTVFTLAAVTPPILLAVIAKFNVGFLVEITGSYPGLGIMFLMPLLLVFYSRKMVAKKFGRFERRENQHRSPFKHRIWMIIIAIWTAICAGFTAYSQIRHLIGGSEPVQNPCNSTSTA